MIRNCLLIVALSILPLSFARAELTADRLVLVVNTNVPDSQAIADFYVKARQLPADRIIALDLPVGDEMPFDLFERGVVPPIQHFLEEHHLKDHVKAIIPVYGVPLKIAARKNTPAEESELLALRHDRVGAEIALSKIAEKLEGLATEVDPSYRPLPQNRTTAGSDGIARRAGQASQALAYSIMRINDADLRQKRLAEVAALSQQLNEPISTAPASQPATSESTAPSNAALEEIARRRYDPSARRKMREFAAKRSLLEYARLLNAQSDYLSTAETDAAFDNELAMLWWTDYPREKFLPNVLNYQYLQSHTPPVMMTVRLDAPTPQMVRDLIATSIEVERDGLKGGIVIDAGGWAKLDPQRKNPGIFAFDLRFVELSKLVRASTKLVMCFDPGPEVLPPNSAKDVALYTGWYSVGNYKPCCTFSRGAVGYHVASYEMTSLHETNNAGWCRGLMKDGVVATVGPVSEPFLGAFPLPDDFMPLLMTGQMTFAEVYWRSSPLVSWKMTAAGDPLYSPYRAHPALAVSDLPERLKVLFGAGTTSDIQK